MISLINKRLTKLFRNTNAKCVLCGRGYPDTVLNIEGMMHHNVKDYRCIDTKDCKKAKKKAKKKL